MGADSTRRQHLLFLKAQFFSRKVIIRLALETGGISLAKRLLISFDGTQILRYAALLREAVGDVDGGAAVGVIRVTVRAGHIVLVHFGLGGGHVLWLVLSGWV